MTLKNSKIELVQTDTSAKARALKLISRLSTEAQEKTRRFTASIREIDEQLQTVEQKKNKAVEEANTEKLMKYTREKNDLQEARQELTEAMQKKADITEETADQLRKTMTELLEEAGRLMTQKSDEIRKLVYEAMNKEKEIVNIANEYNNMLDSVRAADPKGKLSTQRLQPGLFAGVNKSVEAYRFAEVNAKMNQRGNSANAAVMDYDINI